MSFPDSNISDLVATTLANRSGIIQDNVTKNNAVLAQLKMGDRMKPVSGGRTIYQAFSFQANANGGWYSGYDQFPVAAQDVIGGAEFNWKQYAIAVTISGLEEIQNDGEEAIFDLLDERMGVAEASMANDICTGIYSDGTTFGGNTITGLDLAVSQTPSSGTYGGIDRSVWTFWRNQMYDAPVTPTSATIQGYMNTLWASCVRGADRPNLIMAGATIWPVYLASLQALQRFSGTETGKLGFPTVKYMDADVVLDGGIGGGANANDMYFLNTKYLHWRPAKKRNMVPIGKKRAAVNQDATVEVLGFAGNLTCSGAMFQGRGKFD